MLEMLPDEMLDNPKCYEVVPGIGYVPTKEATRHEADVVIKHNIVMQKLRERVAKNFPL